MLNSLKYQELLLSSISISQPEVLLDNSFVVGGILECFLECFNDSNNNNSCLNVNGSIVAFDAGQPLGLEYNATRLQDDVNILKINCKYNDKRVCYEFISRGYDSLLTCLRDRESVYLDHDVVNKLHKLWSIIEKAGGVFEESHVVKIQATPLPLTTLMPLVIGENRIVVCKSPEGGFILNVTDLYGESGWSSDQRPSFYLLNNSGEQEKELYTSDVDNSIYPVPQGGSVGIVLSGVGVIPLTFIEHEEIDMPPLSKDEDNHEDNNDHGIDKIGIEKMPTLHLTLERGGQGNPLLSVSGTEEACVSVVALMEDRGIRSKWNSSSRDVLVPVGSRDILIISLPASNKLYEVKMP
jgi:hypothetical protein